jgi:hypothetical protein
MLTDLDQLKDTEAEYNLWCDRAAQTEFLSKRLNEVEQGAISKFDEVVRDAISQIDGLFNEG